MFKTFNILNFNDAMCCLISKAQCQSQSQSWLLSNCVWTQLPFWINKRVMITWAQCRHRHRHIMSLHILRSIVSLSSPRDPPQPFHPKMPSPDHDLLFLVSHIVSLTWQMIVCGDNTMHRAHFSPSSSCAKLSFYISELSVGNQAPEPLLALIFNCVSSLNIQ